MTPEKIQIANFSLSPIQLKKIVEILGQAGHLCIVSENLDESWVKSSTPGVKLILLGISDDDLPGLLPVIRAVNKPPNRLPILACLSSSPSQNTEALLSSEIDDYLIPPMNYSDVWLRVRRLLQQQKSKPVEHDLPRTKQCLVNSTEMPRLIGQAPSFVVVKEKIPRVAACDATVLLSGETGTGKEMVARSIHYFSPRSGGSFVPINCSAVPTDLFENELFGHESGAFTDARQPHKGLIAEAEGGTLFLDEIDSLPLFSQVKLLRFLQDRQYKPLGASNYKQANVRLVAASNQNLQTKVKERAFREDLFFRLNLVTLSLPSLRERSDDIMPLALYFLEQAARDYRRPVSKFSQNATRKLLAYQWPGNVRELENIVRQAVIFADDLTLQEHELNLNSSDRETLHFWKEPFNTAKARMIESFERDYLRQVLVNCGGNISQAAREAQKDRRTFFGLLKKYGLTHAEKIA